MHTIKELKNKTITAILILAIALSLIFGTFAFAIPQQHNAAADTVEFDSSSIGLGNGDFSTTTGSYPASPGSWTGAAMDGGTGNVVSGVVDLTSTAYFGTGSGNKAFKLDQYPEYADQRSKPQTIFGENTQYQGSDAKTLLINTAKGASAAFAYSSTSMTFPANAFFRLSAWVKTGDFAPETGATIKLSGLGQDCSFLNINTVKDIDKANGIPVLTRDNDFGWVKYTFYVRSSASYSSSVRMVLGIGNGETSDDEQPSAPSRPASGYAFFDTVTAERISAHDFATETSYFVRSADRDNVYYSANGTSLAIDLYDTQSFAVDNGMGGTNEIGTFSQNTDAWIPNVFYNENDENVDYAGIAHSFVYNSESIISDLDDPKTNINGFTNNPWSPFGRAEYASIQNPMFEGDNNANIMVISTYNGKTFDSAAYGIASPTVTIERFKYYRFGFWVKTDSVTDGVGASLLIKGCAKGSNKVTTLSEYTSLTGDTADAQHYGWKEQVYYIRGSVIADYNVRFEFWLGAPTSKSRGIAMFDNVTFTELPYSEYSARSSADGGTLYSIDPTSVSTGVTNGNFFSVGDYDEIKFPMPVAEWSYLTPDEVTANGYSKNAVDTENAVHGLIPTDDETFNKISASGAVPGIRNPGNMTAKQLYNVLVLSSSTPTAYCYQSTAITLTNGTANKITVSLAVEGVTNGNGAALVLKTTDGDVVSVIENIKSTNGTFKTYTFYLAAPSADKNVYLEIWLGLNDRKDNKQKLSNGTVYVENVSLTEWTVPDSSGNNDAEALEAEFDAQFEKYKSDIANASTRKAMDYGIYDFDSLGFDYYDYNSYANDKGFGTPYLWSKSSANENVISGIFNTNDMKDLTVYDGFDKKDLSGSMLYIFHTENNRTTYTSTNTPAFAQNTYYRVDIPVKVRLHLDADEDLVNKDAIGANIKLSGTNAEFTDIKETYTVIAKDDPTTPENDTVYDYETFKVYSFYVSTGEDGGGFGLEISFGGTTQQTYVRGTLIVGNMTITEIDNVEFETAETTAADENNENSKYITTVKLSEEDDDDDNNNNTTPNETEIQWWLIPTIIFSFALIAAVVIILVIKLRDHFKQKRKKKAASTGLASDYDRDGAIKHIDRLQALQDSDNDNVEREESDELDDEPAPRPEAPETEENDEPANEPAPEEKAKAPVEDLDD